MKKDIFKYLFVSIIAAIISSLVTVGATGYLYDSREVKYQNDPTKIKAGNVQDAIDELYAHSRDFNEHELLLNGSTAGMHNSLFRGKDITDYYTDGTLYTRISSGTFDDLYVGDYIVANGVNWRIAGFDIYYGKGVTALTTHHAVIVPDTALTSAQMNETNDTTLKLNPSDVYAQGYPGSKMYNTTLPSVLSTYITPVFGSHVLEYRNLLAHSVNTTLTNRFGSASGGTNSWAWYTRKLDLMNENQVYGSIVWSSTGYETGSDNVQFPLFRLAPEYMSKNRQWYWLRNVTSASNFARVDGDGPSDSADNASSSSGVRPYFYID